MKAPWLSVFKVARRMSGDPTSRIDSTHRTIQHQSGVAALGHHKVQLPQCDAFGPEGFGFFDGHFCIERPALFNLFPNGGFDLLWMFLCGLPVAVADIQSKRGLVIPLAR